MFKKQKKNLEVENTLLKEEITLLQNEVKQLKQQNDDLIAIRMQSLRAKAYDFDMDVDKMRKQFIGTLEGNTKELIKTLRMCIKQSNELRAHFKCRP